MTNEPAATKVTGQPAARQIANKDGHEIVSIVEIGDKLFRAVHDTELYEPATEVIPAYWYWVETWRSGLVDSVDAAMKEALVRVPWLKERV